MKPATNTAQRILNALPVAGTGVGATVKQVAVLASRHRLSVQRAIKPMVATGQVVVVGKRITGKRGQPALRYAIPAPAQ